MKKTLFFAIFVLGFFCIIKAQNTATQPILKLSVAELSKLGITYKNQHIIYKNYIPTFENFPVSFNLGKDNSDVADSIPSTNFDFYPYYITKMDSLTDIVMTLNEENELKQDPLFQRKMMSEYLVPVLIKQTDETGKSFGDDILLWFTPTESFCKAIPQKYTITRKYVSDSLITSDVALELSDKELKNIGFVIDDEEMYLNTYIRNWQSKPEDKYICTWFNSKKESGVSLMSGNIKDKLEKKDPKNKNYKMGEASYYIVKVVFVDGKENFDWKYKGRVIPIYIRNSNRNYKEKKDVIIYLKYTPDLGNKIIGIIA